MTNEHQIFTRAIPQVIYLEEEYTYELEISGTPQYKQQGKPYGQIKVVIPYDGQKYFNRDAIKDIEYQMPSKQIHEPSKVRAGYVGLTKTSFTDLETRTDLSMHHDVLPIDALIRDERIKETNTNSLYDDCNAGQISLEYTPGWPETIPLSVKVDIFDEDSIETYLKSLSTDGTGELSSVASEIAKQVSFQQSLFFKFDIGLALPNRAAQGFNNKSPKITHMALEWPVATSHRLVRLGIGEQNNWPVIYNPENGVIEWANIPFDATGKSEGTNLYQYKIPPIHLFIDQPGELYRRKELRGEIQIEIPQPFSGLHLSYFDALGKLTKIPIEQRTNLVSKIIVNLEDCFEQKIYSPYQHIQFEGVILDQMRINDIVTLLQDQRFTCRWDNLPTARPSIQQYLIIGKRPEGTGELLLGILVEGSRFEATRESEIPGGQKFISNVETGNTTIYMRGQLRGDNKRLLHTMNEIQILLKERFRHVLTIG